MSTWTNLSRGTPRLVLIVVAALALIVGGVVAVVAAQAGAATSATPTVAPTADEGSASDAAGADTGAAGGLQDPITREPTVARTDATATRVTIPAIGVDSGLEQLAIDPATGVLDPPEAFLSAGWYRDGTVPGDLGPAVIAGHVDSRTAPAVFARLGELKQGDQITVALSDGSSRVFAVDSMASAPKNAFPTAEVYGPTPTAQLRLITCDGDFDRASGHYVDNLIVFASLVG